MRGHRYVLLGILLPAIAFGVPGVAWATPSPFAVRETATSVVATLVPPARTTPEPMAAPSIERDYTLGDAGKDVYRFKQRLQELGYFREGAALSDKITEKTLERVNDLLATMDREPVEIITMELQNLIFVKDELAIVEIPVATPTPTPQPIIGPVGTPELPELTEDGFLADAEGEFIFQDDEDGLWYYIAGELYVNIRRYTDIQERNVWYETEIKTRGTQQLQSYFSDPRSVSRTPVSIARTNRAVLAFTDDYFSMRKYGVAIRDGEIYRDYIRRTSRSYPLGDSLAVFADGSMAAYAFDAYTAEEFLTMDAVQVLSFGPWLLHEGEINDLVLDDSYMHYHEPRNALGMIEPGHYFILTVDGRYEGAIGVYIGWLAERMREVGVTEAINLDGGGTTALIFMGMQISRVSYSKPDGTNTRRVSSLLGFGTSDAVPEP